jgi:hypothetical protein
MILVHENTAIVNGTNHPKRGTRNDIGSWKHGNRQYNKPPKTGAIEMILVHKNMLIAIEQTTHKRGTRNDIGSWKHGTRQ